MLAPAWLRPVARPDERLSVVRAGIPSPALNRFLYTAVGGGWLWTDRLAWTQDAWREYLERPEVETWVAYLEGTPAGYCELEQQAEGSVEIAYFGLLPEFTGRRIGAYLLSAATARAWSLWRRRRGACGCTRAAWTARARCLTTRRAASASSRPRPKR